LHRDDVDSLLAASDVFIFPSRFEGLPGALIEAEAAGLPVICSDIENNREVAKENKNALYFKVNDAKTLAKQMNKIILDSEMRTTMGRESLLIHKNKFQLEGVHQMMVGLLNKIISPS